MFIPKGVFYTLCNYMYTVSGCLLPFFLQTHQARCKWFFLALDVHSIRCPVQFELSLQYLKEVVLLSAPKSSVGGGVPMHLLLEANFIIIDDVTAAPKHNLPQSLRSLTSITNELSRHLMVPRRTKQKRTGTSLAL